VPGTGEPMGRPASNASHTQLGAFQGSTDARSPSGARTAGPDRPSHSVLADRIASILIHHEPGWRLPRHSAMARRYNVTTTEIDAALEELVDRHLIRRLPDGQLYRASPVEYLIRLEGMPGLASHIDPMSAVIACRSFHVSERRAPEAVARVLRVDAASVYMARLMWTASGQPAALVITYFASPPPGLALGAQPTSPASAITVLPPLPDGPSGQQGAGNAEEFAMRSVSVEMLPPPPSVAKSLGMTAGTSAIVITVRFEDPRDGNPTALTVVALQPDMFRIAIESAEPADAGQSWAGALEDAER
jgi:hypothetical protein